jgi:hypothetical protein
MSTSYLYLIYNGQHYKIGISKEPQKRLKQLQTASPAKLSIVKTYKVPSKVARKLEQQLHHMFWQSRVRCNGEWFEMSPDHIQLIEEWLNTLNVCVYTTNKHNETFS